MAMHMHIRNQMIAEACAAGETVSALSARFNLTLPTVKKILEKYQIYHRLRRERPLPGGVSLLTAVIIEQAIGVWPSTRNLDEIENRSVDVMKSCTTRVKDLRIALAEI